MQITMRGYSTTRQGNATVAPLPFLEKKMESNACIGSGVNNCGNKVYGPYTYCVDCLSKSQISQIRIYVGQRNKLRTEKATLEERECVLEREIKNLKVEVAIIRRGRST